MKPRHAAALALVGWYLMAPPSVAETSWVCAGGLTDWIMGAWIGDTKHRDDCAKLEGIADPHAPLSKWFRLGAFDTIVQCEAERNENHARGRENSTSPLDPAMQQECIASDDPRLAK